MDLPIWRLATHSNSNLRNPQEALSLALQARELADYQDPGFLLTPYPCFLINEQKHMRL